MRFARERGNEPLREFLERSRYWSLDSVPMFVGMVPMRLFTWISRRRRFGKEEKSKFWRLSLSPTYAKVYFNNSSFAVACYSMPFACTLNV